MNLLQNRFNCEMCGSCCRQLYRNKSYETLDKGDGSCIYLDISTNLCSIYETRPLICRVDDFYDQNLLQTLSKEEYYQLNYLACKSLQKIK